MKRPVQRSSQKQTNHLVILLLYCPVSLLFHLKVWCICPYTCEIEGKYKNNFVITFARIWINILLDKNFTIYFVKAKVSPWSPICLRIFKQVVIFQIGGLRVCELVENSSSEFRWTYSGCTWCTPRLLILSLVFPKILNGDVQVLLNLLRILWDLLKYFHYVLMNLSGKVWQKRTVNG